MSARTIILSLRVMNGFRLNDDFVPEEIDDDMYNFTYIEEQEAPSHDEVNGNKEMLITLLHQLADRLAHPDWKEIKYKYEENETAAEQVFGKVEQKS